MLITSIAIFATFALSSQLLGSFTPPSTPRVSTPRVSNPRVSFNTVETRYYDDHESTDIVPCTLRCSSILDFLQCKTSRGPPQPNPQYIDPRREMKILLGENDRIDRERLERLNNAPMLTLQRTKRIRILTVMSACVIGAIVGFSFPDEFKFLKANLLPKDFFVVNSITTSTTTSTYTESISSMTQTLLATSSMTQTPPATSPLDLTVQNMFQEMNIPPPRNIDEIRNILAHWIVALQDENCQYYLDGPYSPQMDGNTYHPILSCEKQVDLLVRTKSVRRLEQLLVHLREKEKSHITPAGSLMGP